MSVLEKANAWDEMMVGVEDDDVAYDMGGGGDSERTPLNSREPSPNHSPLGSPNVRDRGESPLRLLLACRWDVLLGL